MISSPNIAVFAGNAHPHLSQLIVQQLGIPLGSASVSHFSDGEIAVEINENVRGKDTFIIQSTHPPGDHLMELLLIADALRRASALRITAVIPYFGYARQDRRIRSARVPISAKVVADTLMGVKIDRVLTIDLHADQIQGFFSIPVDNLYGSPILLNDLCAEQHTDLVVVAPDVGGVVRARAIAKLLNSDLAIIDKRREKANHAEVMHIIGDVRNKTAVLVDDLIDTAGTLCGAAKELKRIGAQRVIACCTHPVLSTPAYQAIRDSDIDEIIVSDSIPLSKDAHSLKQLRVISLSTVLAESIRRISNEESISSMLIH